MHLLVLSAFRLEALAAALKEHIELFQCTFWCSVLSDLVFESEGGGVLAVSMHLLVLSAFQQVERPAGPSRGLGGFNAPSGAQCFPTRCTSGGYLISRCFNAPSGAQRFPTRQRRGSPRPPSGLNAPI